MLVMGEMGELGDVAGDLHRELGKVMAEARPRAVFWKGGYLPQIKDGLALGGWSGEVLEADKESFQKRFAELDLEQGVILFKGSRLNKLEQLVEIFKQNNADKKDR